MRVTIGDDWLTSVTGRPHREEAVLVQLKGSLQNEGMFCSYPVVTSWN